MTPDLPPVAPKPRLLDLYCGAGGAAKGYQEAGFYVVGVDIAPQPNYCGDEFIQGDALDILRRAYRLDEFHAIHASPPCQAYSSMSECRPDYEYPTLVEQTCHSLRRTGLPFVIENVPGAPLASSDTLFGEHGVMLCGQMFGLELYRHRLFETSFPVVQPEHPSHVTPASAAGHWEPGTIMSVAGHCAPKSVAQEAMGIDWMTTEEMAEAIPPAYTRFIGEQLMQYVKAEVQP